MGKVIYLMVRIDQVPPLNLTRVLNWCHYSFDLVCQPVPNLQVEVRPIGNQLWAVFFREAFYRNNSEKTPLDLSDQQLKSRLLWTIPGLNVQEFRERTYIVLRLDSSRGYYDGYSEEQSRWDVDRAFFYAKQLFKIDPHLDPGNAPFVQSFVLEGVHWGAIRSHSFALPKPKEPEKEKEPVSDPAKKIDIGSFLKPKDEGGTDE